MLRQFHRGHTYVLTHLHESADDKELEIAELEERLRQLKEDESKSTETIDTPIYDPEEDDEGSFDDESEESVMFSERWKEAKDKVEKKQQDETMGGIAKVGLAIGALVLLGLFSQIPVGEENLMKYQDIKGNPSRIDLGDLNNP